MAILEAEQGPSPSQRIEALEARVIDIAALAAVQACAIAALMEHHPRSELVRLVFQKKVEQLKDQATQLAFGDQRPVEVSQMANAAFDAAAQRLLRLLQGRS